MRKKYLEHSHGEETRETEKTMQERKKGGTSKQITHTLGSESRRKTPLLTEMGGMKGGSELQLSYFHAAPTSAIWVDAIRPTTGTNLCQHEDQPSSTRARGAHEAVREKTHTTKRNLKRDEKPNLS